MYIKDPCLEIELSSSGITNEFVKINGTGILLGRYIRERLPLNDKPSYRHESNPVFLFWLPNYRAWAVMKYSLKSVFVYLNS